MIWQLKRRFHALDVLDRQVDQQSLDGGEQVAHTGQHHMADSGVTKYFVERVRKVGQDHDRLCAGILELVFEFTCLVQRIDVDDDHAGAQGAERDDRMLQQVWQHDGNAAAARQVQVMLQKSREIAREAIEIAIA